MRRAPRRCGREVIAGDLRDDGSPRASGRWETNSDDVKKCMGKDKERGD